MRVYVASAMPTSYPFKLQKPSTVSSRVRDSAESFIMDSGIGDDVSNKEVLDLAAAYDADFVVAKDFLHEQERTTESVHEFMDLYQEHETEATPMIPLQPPFDKHYAQLDGFNHYVLGGMALDSVDTSQQIRWIEQFRRVAPNVYAHGLGVGGGIEFVQKVAGRGLLDSIDCSTPEQAAMFGAILDKRLRQQDVMTFPGGEGKSKRTYAIAEFNSWQLNDVWELEAQSGGLEHYV